MVTERENIMCFFSLLISNHFLNYGQQHERGGKILRILGKISLTTVMIKQVKKTRRYEDMLHRCDVTDGPRMLLIEDMSVTGRKGKVRRYRT